MKKITYAINVNVYRLLLMEANDGSDTGIVLMYCVHREGIDKYQKWYKSYFKGCKYRVDKRDKYSKNWQIGV